jgi:hypothetical protein
VTPLVVIDDSTIPEITGAVVSTMSDVVKVKSPEAARLPAASRERTR